MTIDLYRSATSAPCATVQLVAAALDLELNLIDLNVTGGDHLKPEFLKINPQHTVPTIVDDGFSVWESRTIARYLANKYGKDSTLYPADVTLRALVDQRLDFDLGTLYTRFAQYIFPQLMGGKADEALGKKLEEAFGVLDAFLEGNTYAVGDHLTIADLSLVSTLSSIEAFGFSYKEYPILTKWYGLVKSSAPQCEELTGKMMSTIREILAARKAKQGS
ncbi:unnamed protein product [Chrysodeixis includens]|uniref:Glutathione S-transferase n=1 Tax=Chrysodeixis includens TaxID=689277 RepID=A0A9N8KV90_CHRIL|nr:unnamed protein product [Chrysodeixis includens]